MTVVLVDNSSYSFYRVTATSVWWSHQKDAGPKSLDNEAFLETLEKQYLSHFDKLIKKIKIPLSEMYLIRDCPRETIWRHQHYSDYKGNRPSCSDVGPFIKHLNEKMADRFKQVIRVNGAEADDVIAILTQFFLEKGQQVIVVANDSDYTQLLSHPKVKIYNPKGWNTVECGDPQAALEEKIIAGDKSDNIRSIKALARDKNRADEFRYQRILNSQMIDFNYISRSIQNRVIEALNYPLEDIPSNLRPMPIQFGLCCLNIALREKKIFCSRKPIIKTIETKGMDELFKRCQDNARDLVKMIQWNYENGIRVFRISSELFPHKSNPRVESYSLDFVQPILDQAGRLARKYRQRLTFHPGQYNVVGTPDEETFKHTCDDLDYHAEVLDRLGCDQDSVMVVHGGGLYGDKEKTIHRWIEQFSQMPERVRRRLVLENCEKIFSIEDCLRVSQAVNVPVVFDTHHFDCYQQLHPKESFKAPAEYMPDVLQTWQRRSIKPKFHVSNQGSGRIGHHSDYISEIPEYLLEIPSKYQVEIDIMVEAKMKEKAIQDLYERYPHLNPLSGQPAKRPVLKVRPKLDLEEEIGTTNPRLDLTKGTYGVNVELDRHEEIPTAILNREEEINDSVLDRDEEITAAKLDREEEITDVALESDIGSSASVTVEEAVVGHLGR
jgi:UV DNA damage endonuclease